MQSSAYHVHGDAAAGDGGGDLLDADAEADGGPLVHNPLAGAPRDDRKTCSSLGKIDAKLIHSPVARDGDRLGRQEEGARQTIHRKGGKTQLAGLPVRVREHAAIFPDSK